MIVVVVWCRVDAYGVVVKGRGDGGWWSHGTVLVHRWDVCLVVLVSVCTSACVSCTRIVRELVYVWLGVTKLGVSGIWWANFGAAFVDRQQLEAVCHSAWTLRASYDRVPELRSLQAGSAPLEALASVGIMDAANSAADAIVERQRRELRQSRKKRRESKLSRPARTGTARPTQPRSWASDLNAVYREALSSPVTPSGSNKNARALVSRAQDKAQPAIPVLETVVQGLPQDAIKECAARQREFAAKIQECSSKGDYQRAQEYSAALDAEIQKSITLELLHSSLATAIEEQDFTTAMELKAELKAVIGEGAPSLQPPSNYAHAALKDQQITGQQVAAPSLQQGSSSSYVPSSPRAAQDVLARQVEIKDVAMGLQAEQEACGQCPRQQATLEMLMADRASASKSRRERWQQVRALRVELKAKMTHLTSLKEYLKAGAARLAPNDLEMARPVVRAARRLEKQYRRCESQRGLKSGDTLGGAPKQDSHSFDIRNSMNQSRDGGSRVDHGSLSLSRISHGGTSTEFAHEASSSFGGDNLSAQALATATTAAGVAVREENSIKRCIAASRRTQDELRMNMRRATYNEQFADAHQLWTQLGVEEHTETQLLATLDKYEDAIRGCRFRDAASIKKKVTRLQSDESKAAEFWRLASCRACRIRTAEALAAQRYLYDDAAVSRKLCAKIDQYSALITSATDVVADLERFQPSMGPPSVEYALDSDFANSRQHGNRPTSDVSLPHNNSGSVTRTAAPDDASEVSEPIDPDNVPGVSDGDEIAAAREERIRQENERLLEGLVVGEQKAIPSVVDGKYPEIVPNFGGEKRVLCEGTLMQLSTDSEAHALRHVRLFYAAPPRYRGPYILLHEVASSPDHDYNSTKDESSQGRVVEKLELHSSDQLEVVGTATFSAGPGAPSSAVWHGFAIHSGHDIKFFAYADTKADLTRWLQALDLCLGAFQDAEARLREQVPMRSGAAPPPLPQPKSQDDIARANKQVHEIEQETDRAHDEVLQQIRLRQQGHTSVSPATEPSARSNHESDGSEASTRSVESEHSARHSTMDPEPTESSPRRTLNFREQGDGERRARSNTEDSNGVHSADTEGAVRRAADVPIPGKTQDSATSAEPPQHSRRRFSVGGSVIAGPAREPITPAPPTTAPERLTTQSDEVERGIKALLGHPHGYLVDVPLRPGSLGCVMEEQDSPTGVPVIVIEELKPHVQDGIELGDTVCFINGVTCIGKDIDHMADLIGADIASQGLSRSMTVLRSIGQPHDASAENALPARRRPESPPTPGGLSDDSDTGSEKDYFPELSKPVTATRDSDGLTLIQKRRLERQQSKKAPKDFPGREEWVVQRVVLRVEAHERMGMALSERDPAQTNDGGRLFVDGVVKSTKAEAAGG